HGDVRDDEIERTLFGEVFDELGAVLRTRYISAQAPECVADGVEQLGIIICDKHARARQHADSGCKDYTTAVEPPRHWICPRSNGTLSAEHAAGRDTVAG